MKTSYLELLEKSEKAKKEQERFIELKKEKEIKKLKIIGTIIYSTFRMLAVHFVLISTIIMQAFGIPVFDFVDKNSWAAFGALSIFNLFVYPVVWLLQNVSEGCEYNYFYWSGYQKDEFVKWFKNFFFFKKWKNWFKGKEQKAKKIDEYKELKKTEKQRLEQIKFAEDFGSNKDFRKSIIELFPVEERNESRKLQNQKGTF